MTKEEIISKFTQVVEDATGIPASDIHAESVLMDDLDMSSLEVMTILAELERVFHIRIKEKELMGIITVDDMVQCVLAKLA